LAGFGILQCFVCSLSRLFGTVFRAGGGGFCGLQGIGLFARCFSQLFELIYKVLGSLTRWVLWLALLRLALLRLALLWLALLWLALLWLALLWLALLWLALLWLALLWFALLWLALLWLCAAIFGEFLDFLV
jgi:hypothetical protein